MKDLNYYNPLTTVNDDEQKTLEKMRRVFNAAIGKANTAQNNTIADYMGANESRRLCKTECSKGWSTDTNSWVSKIKTDATPTTDTPAQGLVEVTNSCKAGCDLKWPKTVRNSTGALGIVKKPGLFISGDGKEHNITHCDDLAPFAPKTNCAVSDYSWTSCSKDCGPGIKTGTRTIITAPQNGGKACPELTKTQSCNKKKCTSVRVSTTFEGGAAVVSDYKCKDVGGDGAFYNTAQSEAHGTSSDCGAHDQCMIEVMADCRVQSHMQDRCKSARNWDDWSGLISNIGETASNHGCSSTIIPTSKKSNRDPMNNYWYKCSSGDSSAVYNASTLTAGQKAEAARKWPGKPPSTYACVQSCKGDCVKGGSGVMAEYFTGGMKEGFVEGYSPLQGDFVKACEDAGTRDGKRIPGTIKPGYSLVEDRRQETESFNRLKSIQQQIKKSINQMQSKNLGANSSYKSQNIILLKKLASYEQASHKLLKAGSNLDTLGAQQSDSLLRKNSVSLSYYSWLTLAISILGIAITKIK